MRCVRVNGIRRLPRHLAWRLILRAFQRHQALGRPVENFTDKGICHCLRSLYYDQRITFETASSMFKQLIEQMPNKTYCGYYWPLDLESVPKRIQVIKNILSKQ